MSDIEIRLFGGFEIRCDDAIVRRFESQKARGLLAYLAMHRDQTLSREQIATLMWSDKDESSARRNLRQVLYSLRAAFADVDLGADLLAGEAQMVGLHPDLDIWVDVTDFEQAIEGGLEGGEPNSQQLGRAARLYVGDFLSGFFVRDCPPFEEWLVTTQERLRESALETFHTLVTSCLQRGESRMGIHYARRLLAIDPLSERAHRQLMRLYAQSSRRTRALAQFEELRNLLNQELGVEPLAETTALYQSILLEELPEEERTEEPIGPLIPLAGRSEELAELQESWQQTLADGARLVLVSGETGIGKTRLVKTCIDTASSQRKTLVVRGRAYEAAPALAYGPWSEIVTTVFADLMPDEDLDPETIDIRTISDLALLAPQLGALDPELLGGRLRPAEADFVRLPESMEALLTALVGERPSGPNPVIVLLSDLHWADQESLDLLQLLAPRLADLPILLIATIDSSAAGLRHPLLTDPRLDPGLPVDRLELERLAPEAVAEIAEALVPARQAPRLAEYLNDWTGGLPLAVTELINYLWDEGVLIVHQPGGWSMDAARSESRRPPADLEQLIVHRFRGLPASARRLLAVAGVIGQRFDVDLLRVAGDESLAVVEACIELMLQRWLIRQFPRTWTHTGRERDIVLFARGARRGVFEFAHEAVRAAILANVNPLRRQVMHREVAAALAEVYADDHQAVCESAAHHLIQGGEAERARECLMMAAERARLAGAAPTERHHLERWLAALARARKGKADAERRHIKDRLREIASSATTAPTG
jgi:DNA-binding SARP family transcriptional activator